MLASLHFGKVLIARRATTFAKVDCLENQQLLNYVVYGRFANAPNKYQIYIPSPRKSLLRLVPFLREGNGVGFLKQVAGLIFFISK